jgi:DDE superfamily endonuclease
VISYRVRLDVPVTLVLFVSGLLAARRRSTGTRKSTRRLGCYRQALFGLAWYRDRVGVPWLGAGFGLSQATAYRYIDEVTADLAARAPGLREALERALAEGAPHVILDGTFIGGDRCREKTIGGRHKQETGAWYSGKKKDFGGNIQGLFYPDGRPMWVSRVLPGRDADLAAAKELVFAALRPFTGQLPCLADGGYEPAGHGICTPVKRPAEGRAWTSAPGPATCCPARCAASANAASPSSSSAGTPCSTSPPPRRNRPDRPRRPRPDPFRAQNAHLNSPRKPHLARSKGNIGTFALILLHARLPVARQNCY